MDIFVGCPCLDGSFVQDGVLWMNCSISQFKVVLLCIGLSCSLVPLYQHICTVLCIGLSHAAWYLSTNTPPLFCVSGSFMQLGASLPTHLHCSVYRALSCSLVPLYQHICTVLCIGLSHAAWCLSTNTPPLFCVSGSLMQLGASLPTHLHCSVYICCETAVKTLS